MAIRGQRFHIELSSDEEIDAPTSSRPASTAKPGLGLVGDIKERSIVGDARPPSPPRITNPATDTGFPAHRKRCKQSAFKRNRAAPSSNTQEGGRLAVPIQSSQCSQADDHGAPRDRANKSSESMQSSEAQSIDEENKRRISNMSPQEIEDARTELLTGLRSSLIERLLKNASIDDDAVKLVDRTEPEHRAKGHAHPDAGDKEATLDIAAVTPCPRSPVDLSSATERAPLAESDMPPAKPPLDLRPASVIPPRPKHGSDLPAPPALDPSSPSFLTDLHAAYFPSLPTNPAAMAWMAPLPASSASEYSPASASLPPSSLRFDFRGHLLPPRLAAQIPPTKGLHHHSVAPDAAGYTIPELARLAHSAVAAQRCIAYQTLGRLLYRLGRGDFGQEGDDLCEALWAMVKEGEVLDILIREAGQGEHGNRTCWVTATEAVWLWRKGGGKRWKAE